MPIEPDPKPRAAPPARILVVDDDIPVRRAVAKLVSSLGFEVLVAGDATEALQVLREQAVALMLTDIVMPGKSGVDLAEITLERHPEVAVVFMSGYSFDVVSTQGLNPATMTYLEKPFTRNILQAALEQAMHPARRIPASSE